MLFLTDRTMAGPGDRFQALLLQFGLAVQARAERIVPNAIERFVDLLQGSAICIVLPEEKLFGVGIGSLVRQIYSRIIIGGAAFLFGSSNAPQELLALALELLFVVFETLLIHACGTSVHFVGSIQNGHCTTTFPSVKEGPPAFIDSVTKIQQTPFGFSYR